VGTASDWGQMLGYPVWGPDGSSGGVRSDGGSNASAAGGDERGVNLGVGGGRGNAKWRGGWQRRSPTYN